MYDLKWYLRLIFLKHSQDVNKIFKMATSIGLLDVRVLFVGLLCPISILFIQYFERVSYLARRPVYHMAL